MSSPVLWLLAGGNGAGKSTYYRTHLQPMGVPFVNADNLAKALFPDEPEANSLIASNLIEGLRTQMLEKGYNFCYETVFSHSSKIDFVALAKAKGYAINLVYVHVESPGLNEARVAQRVSEGGHNVPSEKIATRISRLVPNVLAAAPLCDQVLLIDNSSAIEPLQMVARIDQGVFIPLADDTPGWVEPFARQAAVA